MLPSSLVISALRVPLPGIFQRPSGPGLTGLPSKVQETSSSRQLYTTSGMAAPAWKLPSLFLAASPR